MNKAKAKNIIAEQSEMFFALFYVNRLTYETG